MKEHMRGETAEKEHLKKVDPQDLHDYLTRNWETITVQTAPAGEKIIREVHGESKKGDYLVDVGSLLVEHHAGTELSAGDFVDWLVQEKGFTSYSREKEISAHEAGQLLESSEFATDERPIVRLRRPNRGDASDQPAVCFDFFGGAQSDHVKALSRIGNKSAVDPQDKQEYREHVFKLTKPFASKGTTQVRRDLGISEEKIIKRKLFDDCLASLITFVGYEKLLNHLELSSDRTLLEMDGAVGTTQALVTALVLAEQKQKDGQKDGKKGSLLVRLGAPAFGLGNEAMGLNYIMNTQRTMRDHHGWFTCGDFGVIMSDGREQHMQPSVTFFGDGKPSYETVFFLKGGGPIRDMFLRNYFEREKPINGITLMVGASRVGKANDWGVLLTLPPAYLHLRRVMKAL